MFNDKTVSVVVPAYNEENLIRRTLQSIPDWVDHIFVVDDSSLDQTAARVREIMGTDPRVHLVQHAENRGVGAAICTGYKESLKINCDVSVVMAGDAQMDPADLPAIVEPVAKEGVDYAKGNRLFHGEAWNLIPRYRYIGNAVLSLLTKVASGYWQIADSQCGYTAISKRALERVDLDGIYPRYGMPNDMLVQLNIANCTVRDVPIRPVYNIGERSGIRVRKVLFTISGLLVTRFFERLMEKYVIRDFHPLIFFYTLGLIAFPAGFITGLYLFFFRIVQGPVSTTSALFATFLIITGLQFLLFAMWFDMEYNKHLKG
ncbi:MAG: ribonuclease BN [Nitrospinae bacterium CG11_big_fil_rev_8_21_14_0_20_56_8]|nr:MAG: ribonuclease BN [Nitrospinae bacterium CG11_big_fil_rev_8_21_14_0_20_56_8]